MEDKVVKILWSLLCLEILFFFFYNYFQLIDLFQKHFVLFEKKLNGLTFV